MASCPVRAEQVLESHGRPLRITLSRPSDCAKYEITLDVALHFGPEDHSCAEKLNKNNDQVGRETLQLFKSGQAAAPAQALVVLPPVRDPALLFGDVAASVLVQLEGQGGHPGVSRRAALLLQPGPGRHRPDPCNNAPRDPRPCRTRRARAAAGARQS